MKSVFLHFQLSCGFLYSVGNLVHSLIPKGRFFVFVGLPTPDHREELGKDTADGNSGRV